MMLVAVLAVLSVVLILQAVVIFVLRSDMRSLARVLVIMDRRIDRCGAALEVEVRRLDAIESELSEHLQDPITALSVPPRL
jgi:hypothetical protein